MPPSNGTTSIVTGKPYSLQVTLGSPPEEIVSFVFTLVGDDGNQYHLQDVGTKKQIKLIKRLLAKLADAWPDDAIAVAADANTRIITGVP